MAEEKSSTVGKTQLSQDERFLKLNGHKRSEEKQIEIQECLRSIEEEALRLKPEESAMGMVVTDLREEIVSLRELLELRDNRIKDTG